MNSEEIRNCCLELQDVEEGFPFGESVLVFKTGGKIFLLLDLRSQPAEFNVKCDPEKARGLREKYSAVKPGYHMNKTHWNTVCCDGSLSKALIKEMIEHSYYLISSKKPAKNRKIKG